MDDTQRIVKCGSLSLHTPGGFFKKRWHSKYLVLYDGSKSGVKRLELFESEIKFKKQNPVKIIPLVDCVRIVTCLRHKTTFTFEVRTSDQFYLLASKSFQDMNDWVNCLRLVAFGQQQQLQPETGASQQRTSQQQQQQQQKQQVPARDGDAAAKATANKRPPDLSAPNTSQVDVLLGRQQAAPVGPAGNAPSKQQLVSDGAGCVSATSRMVASSITSANLANGTPAELQRPAQPLTASQAAEIAASALAKARQRQPSLLGSCKPQPPDDSPFIKQAAAALGGSDAVAVAGGEQMDTLTPTVRGQLIAAATSRSNTCNKPNLVQQTMQAPRSGPDASCTRSKQSQIGPTLDEEEENMLYCSIEDNPSEHNYRVKVIETELALRCQLKCYQLTGSTTISQQYEELAQFRSANPTLIGYASNNHINNNHPGPHPTAMVTFYQLIIGPQELTLLNDYATTGSVMTRTTPTNLKLNQQGLWSWPYQCIRRYGFDKDNCFMFEAGRKCTSGPGQFVVQTPKAYNIYQDVVKFVNELRTISAGGQSQRPIAMTQAQTNDSIQLRNEHQSSPTPKQLIVTQIPVTWTPSGTTPSAIHTNTATDQPNGAQSSGQSSSDVVATRRQFFDGLQRQPPDGQQGADGALLDGNQDRGETAARSRMQTAKGPASFAGPNPVDSPDNQPAQGNNQPKPPRPPPMKKSITMTRAAVESQAQKLQKRSQSSSMSSCASDETDESGYEQGDDSVDSGAGNASSQRTKPPGQAVDDPSGRTVVDGLRGAGPNRFLQSDHSSSNMTSTASTCSPVSSASNSPGQSISRRTADLMASSSHSSGGSSNGSSTCHGSTRPRLPFVNEFKTQTAHHKMQDNPTRPGDCGSSSNLHSLLTANLMDDTGGARSETHVGPKEPKNIFKKLKDHRFDDDFETSLIRDVYSEISKLHAQFAVTSTGAEDSLSSEGESAVASSSSLENNTELLGAAEDENCRNQSDVEHLAVRNTDDRLQDDEPEPMYSNLKSVAELNSSRGSTDKHDVSDRNYPVSNSTRSPGANRMHFHEPMRPPPLYPSMLNPIPEIVEHHHNPTPPNSHQNRSDRPVACDSKTSRTISTSHRQPLKQADFNNELDKSMDLPRARLALNREAIKKSQQSIGPQQCQQPVRQKFASPSTGQLMNRPTNHYLINDVQYAKISRNMAPVGKSQHQENNQRRR